MQHLFRGRGRGQQPSQQKKDAAATQLLPETTWTDDSTPSGIPPEGKVVVTISRQFGSGGAEIGRIVAGSCGLLYLDYEIIDEVAKRLGINTEQAARQDEHTPGAVGHILDALQASSPFTWNLSMGSLLKPGQVPEQARELAYFRLTQKVILELAAVGDAVIVGRGAQFILHGAPRVLHIYIFAPLAHRIQNIMQRFQLTQEQAIQLIERRDYEHEAYLRHYYGASQDQPALYHLLINTGLFPYELAANLICQALPLAQEIKG